RRVVQSWAVRAAGSRDLRRAAAEFAAQSAHVESRYGTAQDRARPRQQSRRAPGGGVQRAEPPELGRREQQSHERIIRPRDGKEWSARQPTGNDIHVMTARM